MEIPAAGEHVFAVESIEKKRSRKVSRCAHSGLFFLYFLFVCGKICDGAPVRKVARRSLSRLCRFAGEVRVSGQVARMVLQVSPAFVCTQVLLRDGVPRRPGADQPWFAGSDERTGAAAPCARVGHPCPTRQRLEPCLGHPHACAAERGRPPTPTPGPPHSHA